MGMIQRIHAGWKKRTTEEKIELVLDILTGIGSGMISADLGKRLGAGHGRFGRACVRLTTFGATMALGEVAKDRLMEGYGAPLATVIDKTKERMNENKKEENAHE